MGILKNRRLEIFAQGLALGKDTYVAARDAGYNADAASFEANARQRASFPEVKARIKELQERAVEKVSVDLGWILEKLMGIADIKLNPKEVRAGDILRAMDMIVKIKGYYAPEKREIIQRLGELSLEELKALDERLATAGERPEEEAIH
jgi:phage terminase small subunit